MRKKRGILKPEKAAPIILGIRNTCDFLLLKEKPEIAELSCSAFILLS